jgi:hypothetical protein
MMARLVQTAVSGNGISSANARQTGAGTISCARSRSADWFGLRCVKWPHTPLISFTVVVDVPEHRQEEIITQIKQLGAHVIEAHQDDKA